MSFIDSESDFSDSYYEDEFSGFKEEESESISPLDCSYEREEASESDCDLNIFPITAQRKKRVVRFADFEYYE